MGLLVISRSLLYAHNVLPLLMDWMKKTDIPDIAPCNDPKLIQLRNMGAASVNILNSIGVRTRGDLVALGSVRAYRTIRQRGIRVTHAMLYAMEGALLDVPWQSLDAAFKQQLVQMADRIEREERAAESARAESEPGRGRKRSS